MLAWEAVVGGALCKAASAWATVGHAVGSALTPASRAAARRRDRSAAANCAPSKVPRLVAALSKLTYARSLPSMSGTCWPTPTTKSRTFSIVLPRTRMPRTARSRRMASSALRMVLNSRTASLTEGLSLLQPPTCRRALLSRRLPRTTLPTLYGQGQSFVSGQP